jgi:TPR repeat protein
MSSKRYSQFCESITRIGIGSARGLAACAFMAAAAAMAAPIDDYQRGAQAFRTGDLNAATAALKRAAEAGHAPAQVLLGSILDQAEFDAEALAWYRKAAEQGDAGGEFGVGSMYMNGEGGVARDLVQAYAWLTRAGGKDHEQAIVALASAYLRAQKGELSPAPDPARAGEWLRKAAALDHLKSLDALASAYRDGGFGIAPDAAEAAKHAARADALRKKMVAQKNGKKK